MNSLGLQLLIHFGKKFPKWEFSTFFYFFNLLKINTIQFTSVLA
jgi:hypothetical protein